MLVVLVMTSSFSVAQEDLEQQNCTGLGCHNNIMIHKNIHSPVEDGCDFCHEPSDKTHPDSVGPEFTLVSQVLELCEACHDPISNPEKAHEPVVSGECLICHSPHSSSNEGLLLKEKIADLCAECHDSEEWTGKKQHSPVQEGSCTSCHNAHESVNTKLLLNEVPELCFNCHKQEKKESELGNIHSPFESDCLDCHLTHQSEQNILLTSILPELCFQCHDDFLNTDGGNKSIHPPVQKTKQCANCHSPHASEHEMFLKENNSVLCFQCHENKNPDDQLPNTQIHEPLNDGCSSCHQPHVSKFLTLLNGKFPEVNYTEGKTASYEICFECHDSGLLELETTTDATDFRNGDKNLHFLHVNKEKGRTCINCHDVHITRQLHLLAEKTPFGSWNMPLSFTELEKGGECQTGCHAVKKYERD